jgi:hypothetical protein
LLQANKALRLDPLDAIMNLSLLIFVSFMESGTVYLNSCGHPGRTSSLDKIRCVLRCGHCSVSRDESYERWKAPCPSFIAVESCFFMTSAVV